MPNTLRHLLIAACLLAAGVQGQAAANPADENAIKAAMVYRLLKFVDWPPGQLRGGDDFIVCTLGADVFGGLLVGLAGRSVASRQIRVRSTVSVGTSESCDVLVLSSTGSSDQGHDVAPLAGAPILTISDRSGFADRGGMIEIARSGSRLTLRINRRVLEQAGLTVSSQVLALATIVGDGAQ